MPRRLPEPAADRGLLLHSGPFHQALRACIRENGLPLDRIRSRLAQRGLTVALSTLSDWQRGHRRPGGEQSMLVVTALEEILRLPGGSLTRLLDRGPGLDGRSGALGEPLDALPGSRDQDAVVITQQQKVLIDAARMCASVWTRTLVRARRDGMDRYVVRSFVDPGTDLEGCEIHALENCRVGTVLRHQRRAVMVAELLFDHVLRAGDTWVFEWESVDRPTRPCVDHGHGFRQPVAHFLLQVRFDPLALPAECHSYVRSGPDETPFRTGVLVPTAHHTVHMAASDVADGVLGIA
ncbi:MULTISPECIES: hypothetical protein [Streptosporangium]|uniref:Transcriptional regulator n=1 Tax=Streptosporangium brasiliense TaxID=47480 RepID=A0ABT9RAK1_9ACTN|nr:hypothetical protein [Streptosporangium brasiliense]MDP9866283.1 hypothetical protein [Streptosporangium brasiliense]